jgi:hypothetical protein
MRGFSRWARTFASNSHESDADVPDGGELLGIDPAGQQLGELLKEPFPR